MDWNTNQPLTIRQMKTAQRWLEEWMDDYKDNINFKDFIKSIQDDAFISGQLDGLRQGKETALKVIDEVFGKKV